jgi:hypothetical protein
LSIVHTTSHSLPVQPLHRTRRRRIAVATAAFGYVAAYGAGVLGVLAIFAPTGHAALQLLATALLLGVITVILLTLDALSSPTEAPRLRRRSYRPPGALAK